MRSLSFGSAAEQCERYRLGNPDDVVDAVLEFAGRPVHSALEIGAGTGKATHPFAARGIAVTALEPDAEMARLGGIRLGELRSRRCSAASRSSTPPGTSTSSKPRPPGTGPTRRPHCPTLWTCSFPVECLHCSADRPTCRTRICSQPSIRSRSRCSPAATPPSSIPGRSRTVADGLTDVTQRKG